MTDTQAEWIAARRRQTAWHEAGRVLAARLLGQDVDRASSRPGEAFGGIAHLCPDAAPAHSGSDAPLSRRTFAVHVAATSCRLRGRCPHRYHQKGGALLAARCALRAPQSSFRSQRPYTKWPQYSRTVVSARRNL